MHKLTITLTLASASTLVGRQWMNERVVVEGWQVWVLCLDVHAQGLMVHAQANLARTVVVQVWKRHLVLSTDG